MKITVCIGSSCHLKGARQVLNGLKDLVEKNGIEDRVDFCGAFCMGQCQPAVSVSIEDKLFSVAPEDVDNFFENEIKAKL